MTALSEYQRLECPALWRETAEGQRREVVLSLGDATLMISDGRSGRALSHWSLPAVLRLNPGEAPALFAPGDDAEETLEIEEEAMVAALEKVDSIIRARRPHPGRLRLAILGGTLAGLAFFGALWLPGALVSHTAAALPFAKRQQIGAQLLADITRVTGAPCSTRLGDRALGHLSTRLFGTGPRRILVLPDGVRKAAHLPGGIVLLNRDIVEHYESAEVAAGYALVERQRAEAADPMEELLHWAGISATFRLLTTGNLPAGALDGYAEVLLTRPPVPVDTQALLARFRDAGVPSSPYAYAQDITGETVLGLIEADPFAGGPPPQGPVLPDEDWVALQGICGG